MVGKLDDALPLALAARLNDEQRQAVSDSPRGGRLAVLAAALGMPEGDDMATPVSP